MGSANIDSDTLDTTWLHVYTVISILQIYSKSCRFKSYDAAFLAFQAWFQFLELQNWSQISPLLNYSNLSQIETIIWGS